MAWRGVAGADVAWLVLTCARYVRLRALLHAHRDEASAGRLCTQGLAVHIAAPSLVWTAAAVCGDRVINDFRATVQRSALLAEGVTDSGIRHATNVGALRRIRRGAYVAGSGDDADPLFGRHAVIVAATAPKLDPDSVISHVSAAAVHELAVWPLPVDRVHTSRNGARGGGHRTQTLHSHVTPLTAADVQYVGRIPVTTVARTVVDTARTNPFETGVVVADHALHTGLVNHQSLVEVLDRQRTLAGSRRAAAVLAFADGLSESVGESRSRVAMLRAGIAIPALQHTIYGHRGEFLGRADFAYIEHRIAGEFDGRSEYQMGSTHGVDPVEVMVAERRRAAAIERAGWIMVRWMWSEIVPAVIAGKLRMALGRRGTLD